MKGEKGIYYPKQPSDCILLFTQRKTDCQILYYVS